MIETALQSHYGWDTDGQDRVYCAIALGLHILSSGSGISQNKIGHIKMSAMALASLKTGSTNISLEEKHHLPLYFLISWLFGAMVGNIFCKGPDGKYLRL